MVNISIYLLIFTLALIIQNILAYKQQNLIRKEITSMKEKYNNELYYISTGLERGNIFKPGCLIIMVCNKDGIIVDLKILYGRTILARFSEMQDLISKNIKDVMYICKREKDIRMRAINKAVKYILENYAINN